MQATAGRREPLIQVHKSGQLLIRTHNKTLSIVAMRVSNEDRLSARIYG